MSLDSNKELKNALAFSIGRKSVVVALLLWFFLGGLGAHRMYLGKVGTGILMALMTFFGWLTTGVGIGFFILFLVFIWWVVDLIVIIRAVSKHNAIHDQLTK